MASPAKRVKITAQKTMYSPTSSGLFASIQAALRGRWFWRGCETDFFR